MKPKVAVVGTGYWGKNLVRNFYELGHLSTISDSNQLLKTAFKEKYPDIKFQSNFSDILTDRTIDAVVLATPAVTHYRMAKDALRAGKHVFVEKPLALETSEGEELVALAERYSRILMVGHILQYH
ncbi:MAG: Gfo/Idh/MocA family oxidoreductase, partial [bacterium]|nr:Gfo/Idh/MocA family oxidoreductase [bacterium]